MFAVSTSELLTVPYEYSDRICPETVETWLLCKHVTKYSLLNLENLPWKWMIHNILKNEGMLKCYITDIARSVSSDFMVTV